jgi:D-sedoheptulose 7-phosphate isomerase
MLGVHLDVDEYLKRLQAELDRVDRSEVTALGNAIYEAWENERFVFVFGNGGSATTASHLAEDLGKGSLREADLRDEGKKRLKVLSLTDNVGWLTAVGNDCGYDQIFVQQLMHYGQPGDLAIGISGSGNSPSVLEAVDWANRHGLRTFGMTGFDGGKLKGIQQAGLHVCVLHWVVDDLFARVNRQGRHGK